MIGEQFETSRLAAEGLGKRFGRRGPWVLSDIDLELCPGSVSVVCGGNGSGKTSLLRILVGLSRPTTGRIRARPRTVGFVPERLPAGLRMTAAQYVEHMGRIRGLDEETVRERSGALFERLALTPGSHVDVRLLSKGNRQKVALIQALLSPVGLLALDEPYGGLDHDAHRTLTLLLTEAAQTGAAVIITAYDQHEIRGVDHVLQLGGGHLVSRSTSRPVAHKVRMDLRASAADVAGVDLATLDGAQTIGLDDGTGELCLLVDRGAVDVTLQKLLAAGFSVLYVGPDRSRNAQSS